MAKSFSMTAHNLERALNILNARGIDFAQVKTLNDLAFKARSIGQEEISDNFTERNKWTRRSLRVRKATTRSMTAIMGSAEEYLAEQEKGFTKIPVAIPTAAASGQSGSERTKPVRKVNRRPNVKIKRRSIKTKSRRQLIAAQIAMAKREGEKFAFLSIPKAQGIYRINKRGVRMIYDMSRRSTTTAPRPWLSNTAKKVGEYPQKIYSCNLIAQLRRAGFK